MLYCKLLLGLIQATHTPGLGLYVRFCSLASTRDALTYLPKVFYHGAYFSSRFSLTIAWNASSFTTQYFLSVTRSSSEQSTFEKA